MSEKKIRKQLEARVKALRREAPHLEHVARKLGTNTGKPSKARSKASRAKA